MSGGFGSSQTQGRNLLNAHGLKVDLDLYSAHFGPHPLRLTTREFDVLTLLVSEPDRVISREEIHQRIWRSPSTGKRVVDTYISRLRNKLRETGHPGVGVVQMRGYRLLNPNKA